MGGRQIAQGRQGSIRDRMHTLIDTNPVLLMGTSTCPFCMEAKRTLMSHGITGTFIDIDQEEGTAATRKSLAVMAAGRTSVPQIWINQEHVGGCDDLKALEASGDLAVKLNGVSRHASNADPEAGAPLEKQNDSAAVSIYPGPDAAFFAPVHSPTTMDHRAVRLAGVISFIFVIPTIVFAERYATEWVVLGLSIDFTLRLFGFPSPIGLLSQLPFAGTKPRFTAGASKQFAAFCGAVIAFLAWFCLLGGSSLGARIMLAMLAVATFLQGIVDFCLGCFIFAYLLKFGLASKSTYRLHVNTRADTVYAWEIANVRTGKNVSPDPITYPTMDLPPNPTDLKAKPERQDEKWEHFHLIKYCHMTYFMVPLSIMGHALPWALRSRFFGTESGIWQALACTGVVLHFVIGALYLSKCFLYPSKVRKEWNHPMHGNTFALPFINFILMAWLATRWDWATDHEDLARVLFWIGSAPLACMALFFVASWIARPTDGEHINPSWMIMPVGNLLGAVTATPVDGAYTEWGWFLFSVGVFLWLALWPITFRKAISDHHSDFRHRSFYGIWIAPPAVAMVAYVSLEGLTTFDSVQRVLFYGSLAIALVLGVCTWPLNFFLEGKFDMSGWALAFPLNTLAGASIIVYHHTNYDAMRVIQIVALSVACVVNSVCALGTLASLKGRHMFTPRGKWSPMSFMKLTHEAFREAIPKLEKLALVAKPAISDASSVRDLAIAWSAISNVHVIHSRQEEDVIFPALEEYFPGQTGIAQDEHDLHEKLIDNVQTSIDALMSPDNRDEASRRALLHGLRRDVGWFGKEILEHLDHKEHAFVTPIARKYLPSSMRNEIVRKSWDVTPNSDMSDYLAWMMSTLRTRGMRTRFLKTWVWAMPERAQLLGLMVYRVVDDVTWVEVARDLPEVVPRGLPGHRRYY